MYGTRLEIRMPEDLVERIDRARGLVPRAAWIRQAVEQALGGEPSGQAVKRSATPGVEAKKPVGAGATPVSPASAPEDYEIPKIARRKP
jgi:hypothetical protein